MICKARSSNSDPQPTSFNWEKVGYDLSSDDRVVVSETTTDNKHLIGNLTIQNVSTADDGKYTCIAVSRAGNATSEAVAVTVRGNCDSKRPRLNYSLTIERFWYVHSVFSSCENSTVLIEHLD